MEFETIFDLTDYLEQELGPPEPPDLLPPAVYHYTDAGGFHGIVVGKKVWATDYRFLNDTGEVTLGEELVERTAKVLRDASSGDQRRLLDRFCEGDEDEVFEGYKHHRLSKNANVYVTSFSANGNQLSQWRAYAANGSGYSIGLTRLPSPEALQTGKPGVSVMPILVGVPCVYDANLFCDMVRRALASVAGLYERALTARLHKEYSLRVACLWLAIQRVGILVPRLKHPAFREEQEWRVIVLAMQSQKDQLHLKYRVSSRGLIPYVEAALTDRPDEPLPLDRVFVGPTQDPERGCDVAGTFLAGLGYDRSLAIASGIPYRAP